MAVAAAQLEPFTVEHFIAYGERLVLDTGEHWEPEDFQLEVVEPILAGVRETWVLLPQGNAKTTLMAIMALYHTDYTPSPWVPIGASSRDQAEIMFMQAAEIVRASPGMIKRFRVYEGYRKITSLRNGGRGIRVYAADASTGDGVIPTLALLDEGHRHPDLSLYRLWKGKLNKRNGQIVMISTAGEPGSEFEETRDTIRAKVRRKLTDRAHIVSEGRNIVMHEWVVSDPRAINRMAAVKEANPLSIITEETLKDDFESPTTDLGDWKRLTCNIPSRTIQAAITDAEWEQAKATTQIPQDEHIDVGVDVAWKHDTFAIQPLWRGPDFRLLGAPAILTPPRDGSTMHPDEVKEAFEMLISTNPIDAAVMDMERAEDIAAWLEDEHDIMVIDRPQGNANAVEDYDAFLNALRNGTLKHTGDRGLRNHVMNAIARRMPGDKKRFDRPSQSRARKRQNVRVIDALTAAAMVNHYADSGSVSEPMVAWR
jgi:phage terminase large subunit-like protein